MPHPLQIVTPDWIKSQLEQHQLEQKDLAFALNVSASHVSKWIGGTKEMSNPARAAIYYFFQAHVRSA